MNTKIKELVNKAGTDVSGKWVSIDNVELFAKLIVQECMEINKQELAFNAFEKLMNRYQEHFGIE